LPADPHPELELRRGALSCLIAPALGGSVLRLADGDNDLLRPTEAGATDPLLTASFPLVPFANRVRSGRFSFEGAQVALPADPVAPPHALHGFGWRRPWTVDEQAADFAVLRHDHDGADWPWRYSATQRFQLDDGELSLEIAVRSLEADATMPMGIGIHPYFQRTQHTRVVARASHLWLNAPDGVAETRVEDARFDGRREVWVSELEGLDNFFEGDGEALILGGRRPLKLTGAPSAGFHVYVPPGQPFFCIEPVSHPPNSFGRGEIRAQDRLGPGEQRSWRYRIAADP
jgi:aldose 1-epimerase